MTIQIKTREQNLRDSARQQDQIFRVLRKPGGAYSNQTWYQLRDQDNNWLAEWDSLEDAEKAFSE